MKATESVVWGAVIIVVASLACATFLISGGHSSDVRAIAIAFAPTFGTLVNLFALRQVSKAHETQLQSTENKVDTVSAKVETVQEAINEQKNGT